MGETSDKPFTKKTTSANRFWGFNRITGAQDGTNETVYMTRFWIGPVRVHIFHRGDQDPDCHDHPWGFWTFPLRSYVEEVLTPIRDAVAEGREAPAQRYQRTKQVVRAFRLHYRPATHRHRVIGPWDGQPYNPLNGGTFMAPGTVEGLIPTIVWREKPTRKWGFTKERDGQWCWVPWKKYVFDGGKHGPCE